MIEVKSGPRTARFWLGEMPDWTFDVSEVRETQVEASGPRLDGERSAAVELLIFQGPRITYGGLGAAFQPSATGTLTMQICTSADAGAIEPGALTARMDTARRGFLLEYVAGLLGGLTLVDTAQILGSGTLRICRAVHGESGSSQAMFNLLGRIIVRLLSMTDSTPSSEALIELAQGKLA